MKNMTLAQDYITRAQNRLAALEVLYSRQSWADVVREAQEIVELALKALLRHSGIEVPRIHDVSSVMMDQKKLLPKSVQANAARMAEISSQLRRDRELAFYGSEDLTPSEFYKKKDADRAKEQCTWLVAKVAGVMKVR